MGPSPTFSTWRTPDLRWRLWRWCSVSSTGPGCRQPSWPPITKASRISGLPCRSSWLYQVILSEVKTAISVPDDTYERASKRAKDLGMSRSEFFSRAAARYLDALDSESVTHQIDLAVAALAGEDDSAADAVKAGHRLLTDGADDW